MFTGIIQNTGTIAAIKDENGNKILTIEAPSIATVKKIGDSIAVDGCCLTVISKTDTSFTVEAIAETLRLTVIKNYVIGTKVNLENPMKAGESFDGHIVQGHIDFVGKLMEIREDGESKVLVISFPETMAKYIALKGSITINGTSLTVSGLNQASFEVSLIPQTLTTTNLGSLTTAGNVNIEIDIISRYLEKLLEDKAKETTYQFLQERGFI